MWSLLELCGNIEADIQSMISAAIPTLLFKASSQDIKQLVAKAAEPF